MTTPTGSVDEQIDAILDEHFEHGAFNPATNGEKFKVYQEQYRKEAREKIDALFRSHMEAVIKEVIGEDDSNLRDNESPEVRHETNKWDSHRNALREDQRQCAKLYLQGDKTNHA